MLDKLGQLSVSKDCGQIFNNRCKVLVETTSLQLLFQA